MSVFKKCLSLILCLVMAFSTVALAFATESAETYHTGYESVIDSLEDFAALGYDKTQQKFYMYLGVDYYEQNEVGEWVITDHYVQPGAQLRGEVHFKTNMYTGSGMAIYFNFDRNFFDVTNGKGATYPATANSYDPDQVKYPTEGYPYNIAHNAGDGAAINEDNPIVAAEEINFKYTTKWARNVPGFKEQTTLNFNGIPLAESDEWDFWYANVGTGTVSSYAFEFETDEYFFTLDVKVREFMPDGVTKLADGTTGNVTLDKRCWTIYDNAAHAGTNTASRRVGNIGTYYAEIKESSIKRMNIQNWFTIDDFYTDDCNHTFTIGDPDPSLRKYKVTFLENDGTEILRGEYQGNSDISVPEAVDNELGWANVSTGKIDEAIVSGETTKAVGSVTYKRVLSTDVFSVKVDLDGGTYNGESSFTIKAGYGEEIDLSFYKPIKVGYTAVWNPSKITVDNVNGLNVKVNWEVNTYRASFYLNKGDAEVYKEVDINYSAYLNCVPPEPPSADLYFDGWYNAETDELASVNAGTALGKYLIDGDSAYYAKWTAYPHKIIIKAKNFTTGEWTDLETLYAKSGTVSVNKLKEIKASVDPAEDLGWDGKVSFARDDSSTSMSFNETYASDDVITEAVAFEGTKVIYLHAFPIYEFEYLIPVYDEEAGEFGTEFRSVSHEVNHLSFDTSVLIDKSNLPSVDKYSFVGWKTPDNSPAEYHETNSQYIFMLSPEMGSTIKVYAVYEPKTIHTVTWIADGVETVDVYYGGDTLVVPENPVKNGYRFVGWDGEIPAVMPKSDLVFTAQFEPVIYYATFVADGETVATVPYTVETEKIVVPVVPAVVGYTGKWEDYELTVGGVTINAVYTVNRHTVSWTVDGEVTKDTYNYGDVLVTPADPVKEGYTFNGWTPEIPSNVPDDDLTFTATWKINSHTVVWDVDGKETTDTYNFGDTIVKPADPVKEGYTFIGWDAEIPATVPDEDLTLSAIWKVNNYTVTWNVDGAIKTENYDYGTEIKKPAIPVKEGYTFIGWTIEVPATMPAKNLEFVAEWSINPHTVTWVVDGKETTDTYNYGDTIVKPADPVKEGYTFIGWDAEVSAYVPDNNLTFTAIWTVNNYKVKWNVDGVILEETFDYGEEITTPAPEKDGYFFIGWDKVVPETMPAENIEFVAQWSKVEYRYELNDDGDGMIITVAKKASGDVVIPSIINGYPVVEIDFFAFANSDITSVTIPEGVKSISDAFVFCESLKTVNLPASLSEIDEYAFSGCVNIETINIAEGNTCFATDEYGVLYNKDFTELIYAPAKSVGKAYAMRSTATYVFEGAFTDCVDFTLTISDDLLSGSYYFLCFVSAKGFITSENCINYKAVDGVLYNKDMTMLYKYPVCSDQEIFVIPESVDSINDEMAFISFGSDFWMFVGLFLGEPDEMFITPDNLTVHINSFQASESWDDLEYLFPGPAHVCIEGASKADIDELNKRAEDLVRVLEDELEWAENEYTPDEYKILYAYQSELIDAITNFIDCENDHTRLHKYAEVVETADCDCTNDGYTSYKCVCGYEFTEVIVAPGHNHVGVVTAPTCTDDGYTTYTCSACGDTYVSDEVVKLGHSYDVAVTEPTCTDGGYTTHTCSVCGDSYVDDAVPATGHTYVEKVTKEPTCTTGGIKTFTCHCNDTYTETIEANGHNKGEWEYVGGMLYCKNCTVCDVALESKFVAVNMIFNGENVNKKQVLNKSTAVVSATVTDNFVNDITYVSTDNSIVSIDVNGNVAANDVGKATITAIIRGTDISDSIEVEVLPRNFTITWNVNGKQTTQTVKEYAEINPDVDTSRQGYRFIGWDSEVPSTMPAENLSFTAKFELSFKMSIRNPSTTTISYGDSIILHADMNEALPSGWTIKWTADNGNFSYSANGETCTITPSKSGDTTFTVTVYDENGNEISKDTQTMKSKAGFFDKFAAFFRKLFGMTKIIQQSINF